ncbi:MULTISPECIES: hypothetical protein [Mycolicibacterium]|uniref:hypothetical protein n=1 Tax=Mycolicibacterium TaxID=1866885 RepID=UPI0005657047|nr:MULTISPECIES: hypothetical protein [Mycolicibacterium]QZY48326.1 hypothetical protein K5L12_11905 [Mycolicibacterium austroafricanum]UJL26846.1 hypothetical protein HZU38_17975 [Mycolicibacterium vanbaalenii]WND58967.1 hypothetical protein QQA43_11580 [Mycolicibacterium vanbaalenii]
MTRRALVAAVLVAVLTGCGDTITGTATWPGAKLDRVVLTEADFPPGVRYERALNEPRDDNVERPPAMLSRPEGCADALTRDIAVTAEWGPGSAAEYAAAYDGVRMVITVLTWRLDLERLAATAQRCAEYETFFDPTDPGIPVTTTQLPSPRPDALVYRQTMRLRGEENSVYFAFENVGAMAVFGIAFPTPNASISVKGTVPQTFLEITTKQAERAQAV